MSNSTKPRVLRKTPHRTFSRTAYRQSLPDLMADFNERCAYSLQHTYRAGGEKCMEVDHHNPRRKKDAVQKYTNLFLSTRHCNGAKRDHWPSNNQQKLGIRFLNCCEEADYDFHILEDPDTHEVVGTTPQGRYHVRMCDLNAPHLVAERKDRSELWRQIASRPFSLKAGTELPAEYALLKSQAEKMIPPIVFLSGEPLKRHRERKLALKAADI